MTRFECLARNARSALSERRPDDAADAATRALGLWRGPPLADLPPRPQFTRQITALTALHRAAAGVLVAALTTVGRPHEVLATAADLVATDPDDQDSRVLLATVLHRCGRLGAATRACHDGIRRAHHRGHDCRALQRLQTALLQGEQPTR